MPELSIGEIREWASQTRGWWDIKQLDADIGIGSDKGKATRREYLHRLVKEKFLEKHPYKEGSYRYINKEVSRIDMKADPKNILNLNWPKDIENGTGFGLEHVKIYPKSIVIVAGVSNKGKTTFCLNFMVENMDNYPVLYMTNEMSDEEFVGRMRYFDWVDIYNAEGELKFEPIERYENWQDVIQPDSINIIDYLDPGENPYYIGVLIDQIKQRLNKGIAVIAIQKKIFTGTKKDGTKYQVKSDYGTGGQYSEHRARLVLHIEPNELFIKKCKSWHTKNPNEKRYKFKIAQGGAKFQGIYEITEDYEEEG